ncbi:MAG TPA: bifunctional YncE family protein/alkaline phosphatase family protein [Gemmataceae bacterium]|nr:bifunctional YncE family protein/alkaline phosphatase family protein [Gemmataceae bacterium]
MRRCPAALILLVCAVAAAPAKDPPAPKVAPPRRVLPGVRDNGSIQMPNQWSLRPAGKQITLGDFPVTLALHPGGQWLAVLHAGYGTHEVMIVDLNRQRVTCRAPIDEGFVGLCFSPDGEQLFASGGEHEVVHVFHFADGLLTTHREVPAVHPNDKFIVAGLAVDPSGQTVYAAGPWGDAVSIVPLATPDRRVTVGTGKASYPYACLVDAARKRLYVSLWGKAAVAVLDLEDRRLVATWPTEKHPTEMALAPGGKALFVACANSTKVSVLDPATGKGLETIACSLYPSAPNGNTPSSLCLTPDGQMLFVANADANNVAAFNVAEPGKAKPLGFIPVGWYPTSVRYDAARKRLYVTNGRGTTPLANPQGPNPNLPHNATVRQYIGGLFRGTLSVIDLPTPQRMAEYSKEAYACSPLRADEGVTARRPADSPIPGKVGDASPIKHVIYVIKENRTYDQVFGDVKEGNGDSELCIFGAKVTPNHHRLAREFVLLDNFYCEGEVSAQGHEWSMGAYASDFVQKSWPLAYRGGRKIGYPSEGQYPSIAPPAAGYIWDRCAEAGVSYRSYGEFVENGKKHGDPAFTKVKTLQGHFDPQFHGFDLDYSDQKRADRFLEELARFEREGAMPQLTILRLPNDHTSGAAVGKPTPTAYVADNDLALGRVVEAVSKSKFWKDICLFVVEDDAQNGSDHVDAHRTVALVISPYTKRHQVDSSLYSTASMLRTMELVLGLKPMTQFDAAARPMYAAFQGTPDLRPYEHVVPDVDLKATTPKTAWGAKLSETFDLSREDAADDLLLNEVVWRSVKGPDSPMPPPVRAAFVFPHPRKDRDDD